MAAAVRAPPARHLRARDGSEQATTAVELFYDLVYVFAITQISHGLIDDLTVSGVLRAAFLLVVVWWAWIYTTWLTNWFDPESSRVRLVLVGSMLASLLLAAAVPDAFSSHALLFALSYVGLQVVRNAVVIALPPAGHVLRGIYTRIVAWSSVSGVLWVVGALVADDRRALLWGPALAVDLLAPLAGYRFPGLGRSVTEEYDIHGGHFAERCQGFVIIALGESIVVTGATAADKGLTALGVAALAIAFAGTAALWWLYFGQAATHSKQQIAASDHAGRLARDAYTFGHIPIVAGIILAAVGDDLLIAHPTEPFSGLEVAMVLAGPALFLLGESGLRLRMVGSVSPKRLTAVATLALLAFAAPAIDAIVLAGSAAAVLTFLAWWEADFGRGPSAP